MASKLKDIIASTTLLLRRRGIKTVKVIVNIGDLTAYTMDGEILNELPFDNESANWIVKCELLHELHAPFVREVPGGDSMHALYSVLRHAGRYMTSLYGPADTYKDMLPNYGFPEFPK